MCPTLSPFAPGDIVRCVALDPDGILACRHIYTVRPPLSLGDVVYLDGFRHPFTSACFERVARAPANDEPAEASRIPRLMADVMRERLATEGNCTIDDLARAGFTSEQIIEYQDAARRIAGLACAAGGAA